MEEPFTCPRFASFAGSVVELADDIGRCDPIDRLVSFNFCIVNFALASSTSTRVFGQASTLSLRGCYVCNVINPRLQSMKPILNMASKRVMVSKIG